jgi:hypothetical protein
VDNVNELIIKRKLVFKHCMDNPCLSEEIDYKEDHIREKYYSNMVNEMSEEALNTYIEEYELGGK